MPSTCTSILLEKRSFEIKLKIVYFDLKFFCPVCFSAKPFVPLPPSCRGRDSSVGIATRYGLDGQVIESRWERNFPRPFRLALGLTQTPFIVPGLFSVIKRSAHGVDHPSSSSAEVKERV
jgi:hypothetical protein